MSDFSNIASLIFLIFRGFMIKIIPAKIKDYEEVLKMIMGIQRYHAKFHPNIYKDTKDILPKGYYRDSIKKKSFFLAVENKIIKGLLGIDIFNETRNFMQPRKIMYIHTLVVKEKYRGKGIGTLLLNYAMEIKDEKEIDVISLHVDGKNKNAQKLYKKFGFKVINYKMEL